MKIVSYIAVMAAVTYLVRAIPLMLFRKKIKSEFIGSLLYYLPYAVLSAMVIPGIFYSTGNIMTAAAGFVIAVILAAFDMSLICVALGAGVAAYLCSLIMKLLGK